MERNVIRIKLRHFAIQQRLAQHCKSTILQKKLRQGIQEEQMRKKKQNAFIFRTCQIFGNRSNKSTGIWRPGKRSRGRLGLKIQISEPPIYRWYLKPSQEIHIDKEGCGRQNSKHKNNLQESYQKPVFMDSTMDETTS